VTCLTVWSPSLVVAVEQLVRDLARGGLVGELKGLGAKPLDADDHDERVRDDASNGGHQLEPFEFDHLTRPVTFMSIAGTGCLDER